MAGESESERPVTVDNAQGYTGLLDKLDSAIASCVNQDRHMALLVIDLSRIEVINSVLGYRKINLILDSFHTRLLEIKRPADILSRINDHRFALIIPDLKFTTMVDLAANKIFECIDSLRTLTGLKTTIHSRTGVALFPEHGCTAEELLLEAETATQAAHKSNSHIMLAGNSQSNLINQRNFLEAELESAFMKSEFELYYQPKIDIASGKLYGAEALLRWNHPVNGNISPDLLVPVIEKSHLLQEITLWILNTALHQSMLMRERSPDFRIAVNLSPELLSSPDLIELVTRALRIWDTDPHLLILEVTETSIMVNQDISQKNLQRLSELGVLLSIDDFGTGYSSYSYLQQLPVQELKIDRSFVTDLLADNNNVCLVKSMINLGSDFGINVLAEGIETPEVLKYLVSIGCRYGQGFYIAKPMPAAKMLEWMD